MPSISHESCLKDTHCLSPPSRTTAMKELELGDCGRKVISIGVGGLSMDGRVTAASLGLRYEIWKELEIVVDSSCYIRCWLWNGYYEGHVPSQRGGHNPAAISYNV